MTNSERITQLQQQVADIRKQLIDADPGRCSIEDIEDVSDIYQANLEYGWYRNECNDQIDELEQEIRCLQSQGGDHQWKEPVKIVGRINLDDLVRQPVGSDGLRWVSPEVGYVDQDEEYL